MIIFIRIWLDKNLFIFINSEKYKKKWSLIVYNKGLSFIVHEYAHLIVLVEFYKMQFCIFASDKYIKFYIKNVLFQTFIKKKFHKNF